MRQDARVATRGPSPVTPSVVRWALAEDGAPLADIAGRLAVEPDELDGWGRGTSAPTPGQVTKLADVLNRPRALFFLPEPPVRADLPTTFRHAPGDTLRQVSPLGRLTIRRARRVQDTVAWTRQEEGHQPVEAPRASSATRPADAAATARQWLGVTIDEQRHWPTDSAALEGWRVAFERAGMLAFQLSIGGDESSDVRGLSAWNDYAPMMALNTTRLWTPPSRIYTFAHEFGHAVRRSDSACFDFIAPSEHDPAVERWCEEFAAALLLPEDVVREQFRALHSRPTLDTVRRIASRMKVSLRATALRLIDLHLAQETLYVEVSAVARARKRRGGGGDGERRPQVRLRQYGLSTAEAFVQATQSGRLSELDATDVLRVTVPDFREMVRLVQPVADG